MRTRWIIAAALVAVGLVWIGQGLGLLPRLELHGRRPRWAVGRRWSCWSAARSWADRVQEPPPGLSQAVQVASAGPTVTVVAEADERQPQQLRRRPAAEPRSPPSSIRR